MPARNLAFSNPVSRFSVRLTGGLHTQRAARVPLLYSDGTNFMDMELMQ